jgi:transposase
VQVIRALLLRHGLADPPVTRLTSPRGQAWLTSVHLPRTAETVLRRLGRLLETVHDEAVEAEADVTTRAANDAIASALRTAIVGIGPILALTIRAEVGDISRFHRGPELASFAGLVPRVESSAGHTWTGPITRQGSPWIRWALVEAAMHAMKRPDRTGRWARRLAMRKGAFKARVALARVMCNDIVRVWPREQ